MKTIWIIDKEMTYREGIKKTLEIIIKDCRIETFHNMRSASNQNYLPDLVIIEPSLNQSRNIKQSIDWLTSNNVRVIILTMIRDRDTVLDYLGKNIHGYLFKSMNTKELLKSIQDVLSGGRCFPPFIGNLLYEEYQKSYINS